MTFKANSEKARHLPPVPFGHLLTLQETGCHGRIQCVVTLTAKPQQQPASTISHLGSAQSSFLMTTAQTTSECLFLGAVSHL